MINVCFSGGAIGADAVWGYHATNNGHSVIHYSFEEHKVDETIPPDTVIKLENKELKTADEWLKLANKSLKRKIPILSNKRNLLRRNLFQVELSKSLYAVSTLEYGKVAGGTGWAVQMFIDRNPNFFGKIPLYVFDQNAKQWFNYDVNIGFFPIEKPPIPNGMYTGIGTRFLNEDGAEAIRKVYHER